MALHPIKALDHVIDEFADYLRTEFRAKDPALRRALEAELDKPGFLAQEPFFQAHRPFKCGLRWSDLPIDARLAEVMTERARKFGSDAPEHAFLHQSDAISNLLSPNAKPMVVSTGTGSGKTECFLLPVIQNAIEDAVAFKKSGLTAILVYPMNALANDQELRIIEYLAKAGFAGAVSVAKYDRGTSQADREKLRRNPPHILLTNYMMLEYLLVRPKDRDGIFANHRCRFLVLDEVHTYRGALGANIALLVRRLSAHLKHARHDWLANVEPAQSTRRYPELVPVGTSATIKSIREDSGLSREEMTLLRNAAIQEFFGKLAGVSEDRIAVFGEEIESLKLPEEAQYPPAVSLPEGPNNPDDTESVRRALCVLAGIDVNAPIETAARKCRLIWDLDRWLIAAPMSLSQIVSRLKQEVPERSTADEAVLRAEVEYALTLGAALPEGVPGSLRLRVHRFIRGGWRFHRCVNPDCAKLYPMGGMKCSACGHEVAPLYLCRSCGADFLRFVLPENTMPGDTPLIGSDDRQQKNEWLLYDTTRFETVEADDDPDEDADDESAATQPVATRGTKTQPKQMKGRPVLEGSFDPVTCAFSANPATYRQPVMLAPARTRCLCCGSTAGSRDIVTPVSLGTSAAVKVLGEGLVEALQEAHANSTDHDGKQRLLVFSDSRQDAAHQARFVYFSSRYDRMRRRLSELLTAHGRTSLQKAVEQLGAMAVAEGDNPYVPTDGDAMFLSEDDLERVRAWEEAPLLDDLAITAGYRSTVFNLGLVGVKYDRLDEYVRERGESLAKSLGIKANQLLYLCVCVLDEMRIIGAISRDLLRFHPRSPQCPRVFSASQWERRVAHPRGFPCSESGDPVSYLDSAELPRGISVKNFWRSAAGKGRAPRMQRLFEHLCKRWGTDDAHDMQFMAVIELLKKGRFIVASDLHGFYKKRQLLQLNAECVRLELVTESDRSRCDVCGVAKPGHEPGAPCPKCHGVLAPWSDGDVNQNRAVRRIRASQVVPLVAGEHTAQVPHEQRLRLESDFKSPNRESKVNFIACSPTLEMGIDVGGLDAIILRNVPPRPDNYAQRGGRAGRRSRIGLVIGYARTTPHDMYFFDKPAEMISGEVPAPALTLANKDVLRRHVSAIALGAAEPGIAGQMAEYVDQTGQIKSEAVKALQDAVKSQFGYALNLAKEAFGIGKGPDSVFSEAELMKSLEELPNRIQDVVERTAYQVQKLRSAVDTFSQVLTGSHAALRASELVLRLLGIPDSNRNQGDADDRSAGYPLRRFAEFGILPGYEFPTEPSTLTLFGDETQDEPISVERRFGIGQFRPDAQVYARTKRWRVFGLDTSSPWNSRSEVADWTYRRCRTCELRFASDKPACPRCDDERTSPLLQARSFGGFAARRDESPVLDEEERIAMRNLVQTYPQWSGDVVGRWSAGPGWGLRLSRGEEVVWLNEGLPPTSSELQNQIPMLHAEGKGFLLCNHCGKMLLPPPVSQGAQRNPRLQPKSATNSRDPFNHADSCPRKGQGPTPQALLTMKPAEVLRLILPVPFGTESDEISSVGLSVGYSLLVGMRRLFMLDSSDLQFELEGPWTAGTGEDEHSEFCLTYIDTSLGGTGYLQRIAQDLNRVAVRALEHLEHPDCESACYRCLKSYDNQRYHEKLDWPSSLPYLEALTDAEPVARPSETGDIEDPRPWLEAYKAGVGSPLELIFLRLFEQHGFFPEKQVPVSPTPGGAAISVADFAVPAKRLAIYVDGAAFHRGSNLRRDRYIRQKIRSGDTPWKVVELRASDLARGGELVRALSEIR